MGNILIKNIYRCGKRGDVLICQNKIAKIAESIELKENLSRDCEVIDGTGKALIPGFANMHTHAAMTLMRGAEEDSKLKHWLKSIWELEAKLDEELVYYGTKLACIEMIKSGTTLFNDQYFFTRAAVKAAEEIGIRSWHSQVFLDLGNNMAAMKQRENCITEYEISRGWGELNNFEVAIHAPYTVTKENIIWAKEFAAKNNLKIHVHIAETDQERLDSLRKFKCTPTQYLNELGFYGPNVIAAHCVWLDENDIQTLGKNRVTVVHNINSNLKLSSGYKFKFRELADAGANLCIGTDGVASSNNLDMLEAMKTTALVQKAWRKDPSAMPLAELLAAGSENGYKAFDLNGGKIEEGALADLCIIDIDNIYFTPNINFNANLIYSAHSDCVESVICNGNIVMRNREIKGEKEVIENVRKLYKKLFIK